MRTKSTSRSTMAGEFVDSKTEGKYKDTVSKVQEAAKNALDDGEKGDQ